MTLEGKKILVTGGTGLIGSPTVKLLLSKGASVTCLTRVKRRSYHKKLTFVQHDLNTTHVPRSIAHKSFDIGVYLAASIPPLDEPKESLDQAVNNTFKPLTVFLKQFGSQFKCIVFSSSIDVYGYPKSMNYHENTKLNPQTPYALAKHLSELYLEYFTQMNNIRLSVLRFAQVYGPNEQLVRVIPHILNAAKHGKPFKLYGNIRNRRKFLFSEDAAAAICRAAETDVGGVFHIAGSEVVTVGDILSIVERCTGKELQVEYARVKSPISHNVPSTRKAKRLLQFTPNATIYEGLKKTITQAA